MTAYSFKSRFVDPIRAGLGTYVPILGLQPAVVKPKRQTVRAIGKRRHATPGATLQLYHGMRTKQCFLIGEAICVETQPVIIWIPPEGTLIIERSKMLMTSKQANLFAQQDGFTDADDMAAFWRKEHAGVEKFEGLCIMWRGI